MPWKLIEKIVLWICRTVIYFIEGDDTFKDLENKNNSSNVNLQHPSKDYSKDAEIEFLKKRADLLEELLKIELQRKHEEADRLENKRQTRNKKDNDKSDDKDKKADNESTDNKHPPDEE